MKGECFCTKDKDGQCPSCRSAILEMSQKIMVVLKSYVEELGRLQRSLPGRIAELKIEDGCTGCTEQYMDLAISKWIPTLETSPEEIAVGVIMGMVGVLRKKVKMAMPLTEKAWFDLCAARGWNPEQFASNPQG